VNGINYYRLQLINADGTKSFSSIKQVDVANSNSNISVYPNPAVEDLNLVVSTIGNAHLKYAVMDAQGRTFINEDEGTFENVFQTNIKLNNLQSGIYFIKVTVGNDVSNLKFVKK